METRKDRHLITILLYGAIFLIVSALFTISSTMALPKENNHIWNVTLTNMTTDNSTIISHENEINGQINLKDFGEFTTIQTNITNNGNIDAVIEGIYFTKLNEIVVGKSNVTNKVYSLDDYVETYISYLNDTKKNNITTGDKVKKGNKINSKTSNKILIKIKYKDIKDLTEDQISVLKANIKPSIIDKKEFYELSFDIKFKMDIKEDCHE